MREQQMGVLMRRTATIVAALLVVAIVSLVAADAVPGASMSTGVCTPVWTDVPGPQVANGSLYDIGVLSTADAWAVGGVTETTWDWDRIAVAPSLIEHWNGTAWSEVEAPPVKGALVDLAVISPTDLWAVGWQGSAEYSRLVLHSNGSTWKRVALPAAIKDMGAIAATVQNDIWGVGGTWSESRGYVAQVSHWDGTQWKPVLTGRKANLTDVAAFSTNDVWAVGYSGSNALAMHWNGATWKAFTLKPRDGDEVWLSTVAGLRGNDVWLGGGEHEAELSPPNVHPVLYHWNGKTLSPVRHPSPGASELVSIAPVSKSELWAASTNYYWDGNEYLWHKLGAKWRATALAGARRLSDIALVPGAQGSDPMAWAVGEVWETDGDAPGRPLIRRYGC